MLRAAALAALALPLVAKPLLPSEIIGTWSGVLLPVGDDDAIDWERVAHQIDVLLDAGVDGIYTAGTAEELWTLSDKEFTQLGALVKRMANAAGRPFQIGASHPSPQVMRARVREAREWNPGAIQVILPDYYAVTAAEAVTFLEELQRVAAPVGLVLYNPGNAKRVLAPTELAPLAPYLVGFKVVDKDRSWYSAMHACCSNLSIAVTGHHFASGFAFGANASYSNVAALSPRGAVQWYNNLIREGARNATKLYASLDLERRIGDFFNDVVVPYAAKGYSDMALDKLLAEIGGWADVGTKLRWPYRSIPLEEARSFRGVARERLPELFELPQGVADEVAARRGSATGEVFA